MCYCGGLTFLAVFYENGYGPCHMEHDDEGIQGWIR